MPIYDRSMGGVRREIGGVYDRSLAGTRRPIAQLCDRSLAGTRSLVYQQAVAFLYRDGDVCAEATGGWQNAAQVVTHTGEWMVSAAAAVLGPQSMVTGTPSGSAYRGSGVITAGAVDLKDMAALTLRYTAGGTGAGRVLVLAAVYGVGGMLFMHNTQELETQSEGELVLNVSGLQSAHIYAGIFAARNVAFEVAHREIACTPK